MVLHGANSGPNPKPQSDFTPGLLADGLGIIYLGMEYRNRNIHRTNLSHNGRSDYRRNRA